MVSAQHLGRLFAWVSCLLILPPERYTPTAKANILQGKVPPLRFNQVVSHSRLKDRAPRTVLGATNAKKATTKPRDHTQMVPKSPRLLPTIPMTGSITLSKLLVRNPPPGRMRMRRGRPVWILFLQIYSSTVTTSMMISPKGDGVKTREKRPRSLTTTKSSPFLRTSPPVLPSRTFPVLWTKLHSNISFTHPLPRRKVIYNLPNTSRCVRVPNGGGLGFFLAVSLPRRGTVSNKGRKVNEGSVVE